MAKKTTENSPTTGTTPETVVRTGDPNGLTKVEGTADAPYINDVIPTVTTDAELAKSPNENPGDPVKAAVDSAPVEGNGYVQPTLVAELSYEEELAARIAKSNFSVTKVAHSDYVRMNAKGLIDFETKKLKTGHQLVIDERPDAPTGTYWETKA
jgi:hypothetical protein